MRIIFAVCSVLIIGMMIVGNLICNDSVSLRRELELCEERKTIKASKITLNKGESVVICGDGALKISGPTVAYVEYFYEEDLDESPDLRN